MGVEFGERSALGDQICDCDREGGVGVQRILGFVLQFLDLGVEQERLERRCPAQAPEARRHFKYQLIFYFPLRLESRGEAAEQALPFFLRLAGEDDPRG